MIGSFFVANFSAYRDDLLQIMQELAPSVFVVFFTLTGATLRLEILATVWQLALALFVVRLVGLFIGSFAGGTIAGDPGQHNRVSWLAYVTQAGVGLGLAREVAFEFESFGAAFATLIIAVIVVNQLIGPPLMKLAINRVGEAHPRATTPAFDGQRDALIFGVDGQSVALARQLESQDWNARLVCLNSDHLVEPVPAGLDIRHVRSLTTRELAPLEMAKADVVVAMLSDQENYRICELVYEHVGTQTVVARLSDRIFQDRFEALGVLTVHPSTAIVGLLDHFVRAPATASLLSGLTGPYDVVDVNVTNPDLNGLLVRELRLPLDTLILSVQRDGHTIISHGYTEIRQGDALTLLGSPESLEEVTLRFET
jgi:Trk K+ transport system NAD-binding subunit